MMDEERLLRLKREIDQAKNLLAELKGQKTALMKQLKDNWKCNSLEEAKKKLSKMQTEIDDLEREVDSTIKELEEKYPE